MRHVALQGAAATNLVSEDARRLPS